MFHIAKEEIEWGGRKLVLETGKVARQADGSVVATYGETVVLATVVGAHAPRPGIDFFPLTVNYQEKYFAAGKIPGGYFKREGRPTERETLTSRLIDRPIRPLFAEGYRNETQVMVTGLSHDMENDPDVVALVATSAALTLSGVPFMGPIGAARVGYINAEYVLNPPVDEMPNSQLDLIVAGTADAVLMVESEAQELSEQVMLGAVMFGHRSMQPVLDAIIRLAEKAAKEPREVPADENKPALEKISAWTAAELAGAFQIPEKHARRDRIAEIRARAAKEFVGEGEGQLPENKFGHLFHDVEADVMRNAVLDSGRRIDGRDTKTVRPITSEVGILPRTHGSALFTRGETQALVVTTLGTGEDEQYIDSLEGTYKQHFMLHYNFPPYSVGETGRMNAPGRREIGHGKLAWRAVRPMLPKKEEFPYTLRVVSEITESNGSSSMATVCGTSLALMDAGVPLKRPVAGIELGLIKEGDRFAVLSDILGDEDHLGDMDFKVAGTAGGITALQMDIKIQGITKEIMQVALAQAKEGRMHILGKMQEAMPHVKTELSDFAPRLITIKINPEKIRDVIGKGGAVIRALTEETGTQIDISDEGLVTIASVDAAAGQEAKRRIEELTASVEVGKIYDGVVLKLLDFGAIVQVLPGKDGLLHISQIANERVNAVADYLKEGQQVRVKVLETDDRGRLKLSMKAAMAEEAAEPAHQMQ